MQYATQFRSTLSPFFWHQYLMKRQLLKPPMKIFEARAPSGSTTDQALPRPKIFFITRRLRFTLSTLVFVKRESPQYILTMTYKVSSFDVVSIVYRIFSLGKIVTGQRLCSKQHFSRFIFPKYSLPSSDVHNFLAEMTGIKTYKSNETVSKSNRDIQLFTLVSNKRE